MVLEKTVETSARLQMKDITPLVKQAIQESGVQEGLCTIFVPHTTAGITINENADPDVVRDMAMELNKLVPWEDGYAHFEGNSAAHIKASLMGFSQTVIVQNGRPLLGRWQDIYFCEFDGPRKRKVYLHIR